MDEKEMGVIITTMKLNAWNNKHMISTLVFLKRMYRELDEDSEDIPSLHS